MAERDTLGPFPPWMYLSSGQYSRAMAEKKKMIKARRSVGIFMPRWTLLDICKKFQTESIDTKPVLVFASSMRSLASCLDLVTMDTPLKPFRELLPP